MKLAISCSEAWASSCEMWRPVAWRRAGVDSQSSRRLPMITMRPWARDSEVFWRDDVGEHSRITSGPRPSVRSVKLRQDSPGSGVVEDVFRALLFHQLLPASAGWPCNARKPRATAIAPRRCHAAAGAGGWKTVSPGMARPFGKVPDRRWQYGTPMAAPWAKVALIGPVVDLDVSQNGKLGIPPARMPYDGSKMYTRVRGVLPLFLRHHNRFNDPRAGPSRGVNGSVAVIV